MPERDPLKTLRGDPTLNPVWENILRGESTQAERAALIAHYREERTKHQTKEAKKVEEDED